MNGRERLKSMIQRQHLRGDFVVSSGKRVDECFDFRWVFGKEEFE